MDGDLDIIFANGQHLPQLDWVFSNNGRGIFSGKRSLGASDNADPSYGVALADLDGDGVLDAIVANDATASVVYRNDGKGNFNSLGSLGAAREPRRAIAVGDLDQDGASRSSLFAARDSSGARSRFPRNLPMLASSSRNCRIGDRERAIDDVEPFAQLRLCDAQGRICEEVIPPYECKETVLPEEIRERRHFRRRAVEWRHRFQRLPVAHELDDPEQADRSDRTH